MRTDPAGKIEQERLAAIDEVIVTVNHKINNPLTTILNYAELLKSLHGRNDIHAEKGLQKIINAANEIKKVTHQLAGLKQAASTSYLDGISMISLPAEPR